MPDLDKSVRFRTAPASYLYATAIFGVAVLLRLAMMPVAMGVPYLTLYPAVVLAYFWCGTYPGHWVSALSVLAGMALFSQQGTAEFPHQVVAAAVFLASALLISWIVAQPRIGCVRLTPNCAWQKRSTARRSRRKAMRSSACEPMARCFTSTRRSASC
jgi:K+-sensing histidine kinase KdpD